MYFNHSVPNRIGEQKVHIHELCGWGAVVFVGVFMSLGVGRIIEERLLREF